MSKILAYQEQIATLKAEKQAMAKEMTQLKNAKKESDAAVESLQTQLAQKSKNMLKVYKILITALLGLQVSPNAIVACITAFKKVINIIEREENLSKTKIRNTKKKIDDKQEKIKAQTEQAKEKEKLGEISNNPNTPQSRKPKSGTKKVKLVTVPKPVGRPKGYDGITHDISADEIVPHKKEQCDDCGSQDMTNVFAGHTISMDLECNIKVIMHNGYKYACNCCGSAGNTLDNIPDVLNNTMLGVNLGCMATIMRECGSSIKSITTSLQCLDPRISHNMVTGAINEVGDRLKKEADKIAERNQKSRYTHMDETSLSLLAALGWVWVLVGDYGTQFMIGPSRGKKFLKENFGKYVYIPLVCDGYSVYFLFKIRQRCWAHVLRHAESAVCDVRTLMMFRRLHALFEIATRLQAKDPNCVDLYLKYAVDDLIRETLRLAAAYKKMDIKFGTHLENAAHELYTFVTHPGMEPTNNRAERALRRLVLFRKTCQHVVSEKGRQRLSSIFTCITTWRQQGLNPYEEMLRVVRET